MKRSKLWGILLLLWGALIYYLSQSPAFTSASTDGTIAAFFGITDWRASIALNHAARKSAHFILFAVLAIFIRSMLRSRPSSYWFAWLGAAVYGITDEIHQAYVPGRGASILDAGIDMAGAGAGLLLYAMTARKLRNRRRGSQDSGGKQSKNAP